jgi:hypothetical protein
MSPGREDIMTYKLPNLHPAILVYLVTHSNLACIDSFHQSQYLKTMSIKVS